MMGLASDSPRHAKSRAIVTSTVNAIDPDIG